ncbi:MAG TPA: MBOAT family O-acyltransferase [Kiritimatiellia bacterium]|nr:MBOAT family O-acyltransferase [Kiritimatiellia bacterium]
MTFVSMEFGILLVVALIGFALLTGRSRVMFMLLASYVFYAYWNPWYAFLILTSTTIDYFAAQWIASTSNQRNRQIALWISIIANLGLLGYFKYTNFGLHILHQLLGANATFLPRSLDILLPVGISFYTFQSMAYTIDVYRGRIPPEKNFAVFALFVSFFPQLVAGPIERAADLLPQLKKMRPADPELFESGVRLLLWGFAKKLVVADRLYYAAEPLLREPQLLTVPDLLFSTLGLFTMLYFDFSAYTDMARGAAALFGVRLTENFRMPLAATSIAEFWRGWHITLSSWVRDYVFIPLGGSRPKSMLHMAAVSLLTMGLVGLWHGAHWNYVIWGLQHGAMMVLYQIYYLKIRRRWRKKTFVESSWFAFLGWTVTMGLHAFGMAWFFSPTFQHALACFGRFVTIKAWALPNFNVTYTGFLVLIALWLIHWICGRWFPLERTTRLPPILRGLFYATLFFIIVFLGVSRSHTFVYFQF